MSVHLRLPKAVRDVPISCWVQVPSGSSKAKEIDEICVRPDVTTLVTGNTEQRVTQMRNCTATSD